MTESSRSASIPSSDPAAAAPVPVLAILGLAIAAACSGISLRLADALLPRLARDFGISLGEASQVITVFAIAYGLSQLFYGPLGDRYGKVRVIAGACAASAVGSWLCALSPGHGALVAARLVAGAAAAGVIPLAMAWIGDVVPYERRQPVLARFLIGQMAGFALGVWAGGYAADHLDWRTPFVVVGVLFLVVAAGLLALQGGWPAGARPAPGADRHVVRRLFGEFRAVLSERWARVVLVVVMLEGAAIYGPFAFLSSHLHLRFGLPLASVGALVMLFAVGGLLFALGSQTLVRRLGERGLVLGGATLVSVAMASVAFAPWWWWSMPACLAMGLGFYSMHNTLQTHATQMAPQRRGAAVSAFAAAFFLGQSTGVGLCGLLVGRTGTGWLLASAGLSVLLIGAGFNRERAQRLQPALRVA